tara:strand:- start:1104 stop:1229 length:126 start_codon:yes stop_codon:yes gene_type:complete
MLVFKNARIRKEKNKYLNLKNPNYYNYSFMNESFGQPVWLM